MPHDHAPHDVAPHSLAELLDLDARVFAHATHGMNERIGRAADASVRTILDLGAGTGAHTFDLLEHFPDAHVIAVDASATMLEHLTGQAERRGLADRVTTELADLDEAVPEVGPVDLVWASASLHHLADPDRTVAQIAAVVRPGGLMAMAELDGFPRFVPDDAPGGGAELRTHALLASDRARHVPTMGSDWGLRLTRAGLVVEDHRAITLELTPATLQLVGAYAASTLTLIRGAVADRLDPADLLALDSLLDGGPHDVRQRDDVTVIAERWWWLARRPR